MASPVRRSRCSRVKDTDSQATMAARLKSDTMICQDFFEDPSMNLWCLQARKAGSANAEAGPRGGDGLGAHPLVHLRRFPARLPEAAGASSPAAMRLVLD